MDREVDRKKLMLLNRPQLLKRTHVYMKNVESALGNVDVKKTLDELRRVRDRHGGAPNEGDLLEAAKALNRIQEQICALPGVAWITGLGISSEN